MSDRSVLAGPNGTDGAVEELIGLKGGSMIFGISESDEPLISRLPNV